MNLKMINQMNNKIIVTFLYIAFSHLTMYAQTALIDQTQSLQEELENLKMINQELRREHDSLKNLNNSILPKGYYMRMNGGVGDDGVTYRIVKNQVGGKVVYSIVSFSNAEEAFRMASSLRKLNFKDVEVVKVDAVTSPSPQPSRRKISQTMEIID